VYTDVVGNIHDDTLACGLVEDDEALALDADDIDDAAVEPDDAETQNTNQPANLELSGNFFSFGSVVALPIDRDNPPIAFNCEFAADVPNTASSGYNFSDDATCGFTNTATGDRESAGDPGLGALASNGGPTQTMLPSAASPLLDFIPLASCGGGDGLAGFAVTTDQRGVTRPQGPGCEIGSVEVEVAVAAAPIEVVITFTG
jgi:hypothetical protein